MKKTLGKLLAGLIFLSGTAFAQMQDVQLSAKRQKLDEEKARSGGNVTVTTKEIIYEVSVENKTFKPLTDVTIKYMIFYLDPKLGGDNKPIELSLKGSETVSNLESRRVVTFNTTPLKLTSEELDAGWYYADGGSNRSRDKVSGVWIRAYSNGKIIGEYANPTNVSKKNQWKDQ